MALYQANYSASEPVWGDVRLTAEDPDEATMLAKREIMQMYPEYTDVVIETIEEVV